VQAVVENYSDAQLEALKTALLAAGFIVLAAFTGTRRLPSEPFGSSVSREAQPPGKPTIEEAATHAV
jgi:hypothetical protein